MSLNSGQIVLGTSCSCICPTLGLKLATYTRRAFCSRGRAQKVYAVGWDPEGILRAPEGGHISRRSISKEAEKNKELQEEMERLRVEKEAELLKAREARIAPQSHAQTIEYLLETETGEMQYETARVRPLLTEEFFSYLSSQISEAKFGGSPNSERSAELESLKEFLQGAVKLIDARAKELSGPTERMRKLLTAPDKKAMLLSMAEQNEIDKALVDLLSQNIAAAQAAGQPQAAQFMEKVRDAAEKFVLVA